MNKFDEKHALPEASIVVLCYNGLEECTKPCVESLLRHTPLERCELILVDNCSSDGTPKYIMELAERYSAITAICNKNNLGYAAGNNCGIAASSKPFVILLNNDTLVTAHWLDNLLAPFAYEDSIALVGPVTNSAGSQQRITLPALDGLAWESVALEYTTANAGLFRECRNLGFFCVAIRRTALDTVGLLDDGYGLGMFEDDDLCARMRAAGFKIVMTDACFVRHLGSYSFSKMAQADVQALFEKNRTLFVQKNGLDWAYTDLLEDVCRAAFDDLERAAGGIPAESHAFCRKPILRDSLAFQKNTELSLRHALAFSQHEYVAIQNLFHESQESLEVLQLELSVLRGQLAAASDETGTLRAQLHELQSRHDAVQEQFNLTQAKLDIYCNEIQFVKGHRLLGSMYKVCLKYRERGLSGVFRAVLRRIFIQNP